MSDARNNRDWRYEYMTLLMRDQENQEIGMEKGLEKGLEQGREQGLEQGRESTIFNLIRKGIITEKEGAEELNMTAEEFIEKMNRWKKG